MHRWTPAHRDTNLRRVERLTATTAVAGVVGAVVMGGFMAQAQATASAAKAAAKTAAPAPAATTDATATLVAPSTAPERHPHAPGHHRRRRRPTTSSSGSSGSGASSSGSSARPARRVRRLGVQRRLVMTTVTTDRPLSPARADFDLWGGRGTVLVTDARALDAVLDVVHRTLAEVDRAASAYRADSDLSRLNAADGRPVVVSRVLREAIDVALHAAAATDGLVDPTVGAATLARSGAIAYGQGRIERHGWRQVRIDHRLGTVQLPPHLQLDLGATTKAWAADRCVARAAVVAAEHDAGVLVSLAGDLAVAGNVPPEGSSVRVTDDHRTAPDDLTVAGTTVAIHSGGLATSSLTVRRTTGHRRRHRLAPDRPHDRRTRRGLLAHRIGVRRHVRGRQRREHRRAHPRS